MPSYSLAKTLYVGLAMTAMAQELEVDPYTQLVSDLLPDEAAASPGQWEGVTLEHLIDMSTGHYRKALQTDDYMGNFFYDYTLDGRLEASFLFPYQEPPGQRAVYLTPHYQIAAAAMDALLHSQGAEITDSFELAVERIYKPAGMPPDSFTSLRTWEGGGQNNGTAFGGYGILLTPQGMARLSRFVMDGGAVDGEQLLHPERLAETLFEDLEDTGAPMHYYSWSYNNGMWGYPLDGWGCEGYVPTLFGVSGVTVMLAPNDVVYFAFNDMVEQPIVSILNQLDAISPLCP
jgi:CubicO group peptidase (beta-lactamase class C family)